MAQQRFSPKAIRLGSERAKALGDPTRLAIAIELRRHAGMLNSDGLIDATGRDASIVSRHCTKLRAAGLVERQYAHNLASFRLTERGAALVDAVMEP